MNNILTSISFSINSKKGVYALLLGSGISKAAEIPTGWDVVLDLIKQLAVSNGEDCNDNPVEWFKNKYNLEPDYSNILSQLTKSPSDRVNLLRKYFEPSSDEEEDDNNPIQPSAAHRSIAKLIKKGYIKVVITTNFDRLLEKALSEEGVEPIVIRHVDDIDGAMPLVHSEFTLIKVNGDYLDSRFLNTKDELNEYPIKLKNYLTTIINDYGIISCGWSGKWDIALVNAIKKSDNYRFASYWTCFGACEKELEELARIRKGETVKISNADTFFSEIEERVHSLNSNSNHPLSAAIAVSRLKRYIVNEDGKIQFHDLLKLETDLVYEKLQEISKLGTVHKEPEFTNRINLYESYLDILLPLIINGTYWAKSYNYTTIVGLFKKITSPLINSTNHTFTDSLHYYPSLLCFYALGIVAVKTKKYDLLNEIFNIKLDESSHKFNGDMPLIIKLNSIKTIDGDILNNILPERLETPVSSFLFKKLEIFLETFIDDKKEYISCFTIFEYLISLNYILKDKRSSVWTPLGGHYYARNPEIIKEFKNEAKLRKENWAPLKAGMFNGNVDQYEEVQKELDGFISRGGLY